MIERGDFKVFHEPFSYYYYLKKRPGIAVGMKPDPSHPVDFQGILEMIKAAASETPVFFKDMPCCVIDHVNRDFLNMFENTFITRHPAEAIISFYKQNPSFTIEEASYAEQRTMFEMVKDMTGQVPALIDARDLIENPHKVVKGYCKKVGIEFIPEALEWEAGLQPDWKPVETWHFDVACSVGFTKDTEALDRSLLKIPSLSKAYESCMPHYEALLHYRIHWLPYMIRMIESLVMIRERYGSFFTP